MWSRRYEPETSLSAVTTTASGTTIDFGKKPIQSVRYYINAASISTGGTVVIEASPDEGTTWYVAATVAISATGKTSGQINGPGRHWRARVSARTDGTYSAYLEATALP